ncbi:MAG: N-acetylmuramic acid 6-phosphate etherase [Chloroflexi bacterium]|jgi:N-acetylmuramic acid 6-phosphate etherase|nr:N-acetylmuramic acid 6-phosphate etherase [Chloroflexota bacterium]
MTPEESPAYSAIYTEARNPATEDMDLLSTLEMVRLMNEEDARVAQAVAGELERIAQAIDAITERMRQGGRLIYLGAGTSGRLGVLDASETLPTFNVPADMVVGVIAGGEKALTQAVENAEDDRQAGERDVLALNITEKDCLVGIAASGQTPYTLSGMSAARSRGALVISLACNHPSPMAALADIYIAPITGPEVISGSTRLKAGTAQKMVLNMISTCVMVRLGKTYSNLMVDVQPNNAKLRERARRIVEQACGLSPEQAAEQLDRAGGEAKVAIVASLAEVTPEEARLLLAQADGSVRKAIALKAG